MHLIKHAHLGDRKIENQKEDDNRPVTWLQIQKLLIHLNPGLSPSPLCPHFDEQFPFLGAKSLLGAVPHTYNPLKVDPETILLIKKWGKER